MNKYFKLLTSCVLSLIAGVSIMLLSPVTIGIIIMTVGFLISGVKFLKSE